MQNKILLTSRIETMHTRNEVRQQLDVRWFDLLQKCGLVPLLAPMSPNAIKILLKNESFSGAILTGGNNLSSIEKKPENILRDECEKLIYDHCHQNQIPLLGVCRGMQFLADLHGVLPKATPHHVGRHTLSITSESFQAIFSNQYETNSFHDFALFELPKNFSLDAKFEQDQSIEAFSSLCNPEMGIMWHPERENPFRNQDLELLQSFFRKSKEKP